MSFNCYNHDNDKVIKCTWFLLLLCMYMCKHDLAPIIFEKTDLLFLRCYLMHGTNLLVTPWPKKQCMHQCSFIRSTGDWTLCDCVYLCRCVPLHCKIEISVTLSGKTRPHKQRGNGASTSFKPRHEGEIQVLCIHRDETIRKHFSQCARCMSMQNSEAKENCITAVDRWRAEVYYIYRNVQYAQVLLHYVRFFSLHPSNT